jgi:hypothetical protein
MSRFHKIWSAIFFVVFLLTGRFMRHDADTIRQPRLITLSSTIVTPLMRASPLKRLQLESQGPQSYE